MTVIQIIKRFERHGMSLSRSLSSGDIIVSNVHNPFKRKFSFPSYAAAYRYFFMQ